MAAKPTDPALYREVTQAAQVGLVINLVLGAVKLAGGLVSGSIALISDAVNSWGDVLTSIIVIVGLNVAQRAPDDEHPYGHSRAETIAASNVALLVILSALAVGWHALRHLAAPQAVPPAWTLWIAGANVVIKESLYRYKVRVGRRSSSQAILANAWDHRSDALCSLAVLVGLAAVRLGGDHLVWADDVAALIVVGAVVYSGGTIFAHSASELMDVQASDELVRSIRAVAQAVPGVDGVEKLWVRKSGIEYFADIHIEVAPDMTVAEGHRVGHRVKDRLLDSFAELRDVLVHLEPHIPGGEAACPWRH